MLKLFYAKRRKADENCADRINYEWKWLREKLGNDWNRFLADCQMAIDQFNLTKDFPSFEKALSDSLEKTNKVDDFVHVCRMGTDDSARTQPEDLVKNSVDELAKKVK